MRKLFVAIPLLALGFGFVSLLQSRRTTSATASVAVRPFQPCGCTASDDSCSVSLDCPGARCYEHCDVDNDCWAYCGGSLEFLATDFTFETQNGTYAQLVRALANRSGKSIEFFPDKPAARLSLGINHGTVWGALEILSERGTLRVDGKDFESLLKLRKTLLTGDRTSFVVQNTPVGTFVNDIAGLTGLRLHITKGNPMAVIDLDLQKLTLTEILDKVQEHTGTRISEGDADPKSP